MPVIKDSLQPSSNTTTFTTQSFSEVTTQCFVTSLINIEFWMIIIELIITGIDVTRGPLREYVQRRWEKHRNYNPDLPLVLPGLPDGIVDEVINTVFKVILLQNGQINAFDLKANELIFQNIDIIEDNGFEEYKQYLIHENYIPSSKSKFLNIETSIIKENLEDTSKIMVNPEQQQCIGFHRITNYHNLFNLDFTFSCPSTSSSKSFQEDVNCNVETCIENIQDSKFAEKIGLIEGCVSKEVGLFGLIDDAAVL